MTRPRNPWVELAAKRVHVWLTDGSEAVLVGVERRVRKDRLYGHRYAYTGNVRVEFPGGGRRTVPMEHVTAWEEAA